MFVYVVRHYTGAMGLARRGTKLTPDWQTLFDDMTEIALRRGLVRFMRYCAAHGIAPEEVDDTALIHFKAALTAETFSSRVNTLHRQTAVLWNRAGAAITGWPALRLVVPDYRLPRDGLHWNEFPESFRLDVDQYLRSKTRRPELGTGISALLDGPQTRPWAPKTAKLRFDQIGLLASAAVRSGIPVEQLTQLGTLTEPAMAKRILNFYLMRDEAKLGRREPKGFTIDLSYVLFTIARDWVKVCQADLDQLAKMYGNLEAFRRTGLTEKNLTVIRKLIDPANKRLLMALPERLMQEALASQCPYHAAVTAQLAVAISILIAAPMRIGNLVSLRFGIELLRPGGTKALYHIYIPNHLVKNKVELEYPLPAHTTKLIDRYRTSFRPALVNAGSDWLFPGEGEHKGERTLSGQLTKRVLKEIGVHITPHQFRHAAAIWLLQAEPGNYELVRRILGHTDIQTTMRFYVGLQSISAMQHYHAIISGPLDDGGDDI